MKCENCGKELLENARFCSGCGMCCDHGGQEIVDKPDISLVFDGVEEPPIEKPLSKKRIWPRIFLVVLLAGVASLIGWYVHSNIARSKEAALQTAADYAEVGDYENAIDTIASAHSYERDTKLNTAYQNYCAEYEAQMTSVIDGLIEADNYYAAQQTATKALGILPKSDTLKKCYTQCQWDEVLFENGEFSVVRKDLDRYDSYTVRVGILDSAGSWICPLSDTCIFATAINDARNLHSYNGSQIRIGSGNFAYLGEGVIVASLGLDIHTATGGHYSIGSNYSLTSHGLECYLYNIDTKESNHFSATDLSTCEDGYMLRYDSDRYNGGFSRVSKNGEVTSIPVGRAVNDFAYPTYSEGLFFANGIFYDIFGEEKINLTNYQLSNTPFFQDGTAEILFVNNGQTTYQAVIDKSGNFIETPTVHDGN